MLLVLQSHHRSSPLETFMASAPQLVAAMSLL